MATMMMVNNNNNDNNDNENNNNNNVPKWTKSISFFFFLSNKWEKCPLPLFHSSIEMKKKKKKSWWKLFAFCQFIVGSHGDLSPFFTIHTHTHTYSISVCRCLIRWFFFPLFHRNESKNSMPLKKRPSLWIDMILIRIHESRIDWLNKIDHHQ